MRPLDADHNSRDHQSEQLLLAERHIIGECFLDPRSLDFVLERLSEHHFLVRAHQILFAAMRDIVSEGGEVDYVSLCTTVDRINGMEAVGGDQYPMECASLAGFSHGRNATRTACRIVLEAWAKRKLAEVADLAEKSLGGALECVESVRKTLDRMGETPAVGKIASFATNGKPKTGCPSGLGVIDANTICGGFPDGQMSIVAAYTGSGKSALMCQAALNIARAGSRVVYGTWADLTAADVADRILKITTGWSYRPDCPQQASRYDEALEELNRLQLFVYDASTIRNGRELDTFRRWLVQVHEADPVSCVFLDYAQELTTRSAARTSGREKVDEVSSFVRWLAAETNLPIVVGSQVTEGNEKLGTRDITKNGREWEERAGLVE